ncbi:MAG: 3-hydroxyacyl-CoA dehydrogenase NAD-binding domain-containing protein [Bacteroidia bacterium]|nr:3-hydroxyacyl-CoA dehydrogenase NAD-binding domain-containing protein [Bacteroidia bacterium]
MKNPVIGIAGCGTMGAGIARVAAQSEHEVVLYDLKEDLLIKATSGLKSQLEKEVEKGKLTVQAKEEILSRIQTSTSMEQFGRCGLILEAIVENLTIKKDFLSKLEPLVGHDCILATNTSSLSVTSLSSSLKKPSRFIGIHFFNPAPLMPLVEIIPTLSTDTSVTEFAIQLVQSWGKVTVKAKDTPGFIVNRVARPYYSEALRIADEGIADYATIDYAMKTFGGFRMGPFELMDLIGHDVNYVVTETVWKEHYYDTRFTPSITQKRLLEAGLLGKKSGRGFYDYSLPLPPPDTNEEKGKKIFERILAMLINMAADTLYMGIASGEDIDLAVTKGVNYPKGLLRWADEWGIGRVVNILADLHAHYGEERYRPHPVLKKLHGENRGFYS